MGFSNSLTLYCMTSKNLSYVFGCKIICKGGDGGSGWENFIYIPVPVVLIFCHTLSCRSMYQNANEASVMSLSTHHLYNSLNKENFNLW